MNSDQRPTGLAYANRTVAVPPEQLQQWRAQQRAGALWLSGSCPACGHKTQAVTLLDARRTFGSVRHVEIACACDHDHPDRPTEMPSGCGRRWHVTVRLRRAGRTQVLPAANSRPEPGLRHGELVLGNEQWPSNFVVRDHRLRVRAEGVTPTRIDLAPGLYEAELTNQRHRRRELFEIRPGGTFDAGTLRMPVDTAVPVHNAARRDQQMAERVTLLSARLRDRQARSGLALVTLPAARDREVRSTYRRGADLLRDDQQRPGRIHVDDLSRDWAEPLPPGGWVLRLPARLSAPARYVDVPIWIADGFQTVLFLPRSDDPDLAHISCHLVPHSSVWTGFDPAASLLELAHQRQRAGQRPFAASATAFDYCRLATLNPMLTLLRALDLLEYPGDGIEAAPLIDRLHHTVPGHPDLVAMLRLTGQTARAGRTHDSFPPTTAAGMRLIRQVAAHSDVVAPGSLLERSLRTGTFTGPYASLPAMRDDPDDALFTFPAPRRTSYPRPSLEPVDRSVDDRPLESTASGAWWESTLPPRETPRPDPGPRLGAARQPRMRGLLAALWTIARLSRSPQKRWLRELRAGAGVVTEPAAQRVRSHLADLIIAGRGRHARAILLGFAIPTMAAATGLTRRDAINALATIRQDLARRTTTPPDTSRETPR